MRMSFLKNVIVFKLSFSIANNWLPGMKMYIRLNMQGS